MAGDSSIAKVKVVKKATLRDDVSLKNKFTYKGMKIVKGAVSHHSLYEKDSDGTRSDDDSVSHPIPFNFSLFIMQILFWYVHLVSQLRATLLCEVILLCNSILFI